ncbi:DUF563 domain-containing protein [Synechococcus sp. 1G10]|uniref:glycosyltransferase family 61 protein n=1 Tax=Synechococcus sp. 1G10 TaxID=2025605 RepID=UPI002101774E|nr:glycosyltransferase 61 family protein [Synechococcus sp. 1G10]
MPATLSCVDPQLAGCGCQAGQLTWPQIDVLSLSDVHLVGHRCTLLDRRFRLISEHIGGTDNAIDCQLQSVDVWSAVVTCFANWPRRVPSAFSLGGPYAFNFFHWLTDCLPTLAGYEAILASGGERPALFVPPGLASWQIRSLELMGYPVGTYQEHSWTHTVVRRYYLTSWHKGFLYPEVPSPALIKWLKQRICSSPAFGLSPVERMIFVDRSESRRPIQNPQALAEVFSRRGFRIVRLEELPLDDQISLFVGARVVAGLHGAGFANLIFSEATWLFEISPTGQLQPCYRHLVHVLGGQYYLYQESAATQSDLPALSLDKLELELDRFLGRLSLHLGD